MSANDFGWYLKTFDALLGFLYIHNISTVQKPVALRRNDWDWFLDKYHYYAFGTYNLMAGYAVETIIKCCLDNSQWKGNIFTHNLQHYAKELGKKWNMTVPPNLLGYLQEYKTFIEWKGKYPIPKNPSVGEGPGLAIGGEQFAKTRDTWTFFFNELRKRDSVLADFYLTTYRHDSRGRYDSSMEVFDIVDQIVKEKLVAVGKYVIYKRQFWRETFVRFMKWLTKLGLYKGYSVRNTNINR